MTWLSRKGRKRDDNIIKNKKVINLKTTFENILDGYMVTYMQEMLEK